MPALASRTATGALDASSVASSCSGTTVVSSPGSRACAALSSLPPNRIPFAMPIPTNRARRWEGAKNPTWISGQPIRQVSAATRKSQASAISAELPTQDPHSTATVASGRVSIARNRRYSVSTYST